MTDLVRQGRTWVFGDNVNTDLIFPVTAFALPLAEQHRLVFSSNRPEWITQVRPGDLLVAGHNFGTGSGRPVGRLLGECGIVGVVADSLNSLAFRNCISFAMPALSCQGVTSLFEEGDEARVDFGSGAIENLRNGRTLQGPALPPLLAELIEAGGVIASLARDGLISVPGGGR